MAPLNSRRPAWLALCLSLPRKVFPARPRGLSWFSLLPRAPSGRDFPLSSRLKRRGDAPRGRSGRRTGRFQVPGPRPASAGLRPARRQEPLSSCADSPSPEPGRAVLIPRVPRPALGTPAPAPPSHPGAGPATSPPNPTTTPSPIPPHPAAPRVGHQRRRYLPRGLPAPSLSTHTTQRRSKNNHVQALFSLPFPNSRILWAPFWSRGMLPPSPAQVRGDTPSTSHLVSLTPAYYLSSAPFGALPHLQNHLLQQNLGILHLLTCTLPGKSPLKVNKMGTCR